ncbi:MAG: hypothetical protein A3A33_00810 [Candidatus Yanofskybacteria bacterium RIFCSPLOWO2_01_FULL_49_25]|uniref:Uncharacterized protein n=1 Tax=Candidatus Yanofskybacteria bacterium RIFCSPLOWO2_01_FULL_49_25 TaxID=1802701 RepID=A0A1F8GYV7_9BACT|nr:MAG: hypothetical protein A3A33_00810 [Candidatus Yanofskybacteria bacterium RIFCSPLOWO2_01_FULL_49_25]
MNPNEILKKILEITGAGDDAERVEKEFLVASRGLALQRIVDTMPEDRRSAILDKLHEPIAPETMLDVIQNDIGEEVYIEKLTAVSTELLQKYMQEVVPQLTDEMRSELKSYLASVGIEKAAQ